MKLIIVLGFVSKQSNPLFDIWFIFLHLSPFILHSFLFFQSILNIQKERKKEIPWEDRLLHFRKLIHYFSLSKISSIFSLLHQMYLLLNSLFIKYTLQPGCRTMSPRMCYFAVQWIFEVILKMFETVVHKISKRYSPWDVFLSRI